MAFLNGEVLRWRVPCCALLLGSALLVSVATAQTPPAAGQPGAAGQTENLPIQIQADSGIEWQQDAHVYIARGNAAAIRGTSEVHADTLIAHYREVKKPAGGDAAAAAGTNAANASAGSANGSLAASFGAGVGGNTEIFRVEAEGHVTLKRDAQTVVGDHAVYDVDKATAVVTGKNLKMTTTQDVVTARDSLEWFDQKQVAVARGDAVAIRNGKTIKGDILTAYMVKTAAPGAKPGAPAEANGHAAVPGAKPVQAKPITPASATPGKPAAPGAPGAAKPGEESKISRVDAQGHVVVTNGADVGRGDFGVYNADTGIATLIRNVVIERGKDVIRGQRGVIDLNNNISRMLPGGGPETAPQRVQGLFVREQHPGTSAAPGSAPATPNPATPKKP